ncbi:MAG: nuclear transport factor 2 family protein [Dehalococcoidia bacterium]|jgi:uncharacterized protein (TIGR02246 family)|nr:nuclear transport factor 2 family protein [Dehalococcoidia bacterium]MDP6226942.1 nuclear transport factor 2 family protein [Dehalococcoidia bacterium]MDP7084364.1 nuclear transport factor 2 family protein [Dehalococcoidia bacterium]MDP7201274.1 nuclear transport factor 2 family protein [Dehalococcoidia bacterium]MDP7509282.1 nuclear transport factor 2 family protein [Dehalococcoidia bacterium]
MALDPALQELVEKAAIRELMTRYARSNDRRDFDSMTSTFTADAYASYGDWERQGVENIVGRLAYNRPHRATHFLGDQDIRIDGDSAEVETYAIAYSRVEGTESMRMSGLRYQDKMVRQDGQWLVRHRVLLTDWRALVPLDPSFGG